MSMLLLLLLTPPLILFFIGYGIGWAAFSTSPKRKKYAIISGVTSLIVGGALLFGGCLLMLSNTSFH